MFALVSFCNQGKRLSSLSIVNLNSFNVYSVPLLLPHNSLTGLCQDNKYIFVASQNDFGNSIYVFSKQDFALVTHTVFKHIDIHSLFIEEDIIYANDTANDAVVKIFWDEKNKRLTKPENIINIVINDEENEDSLHVNSVIRDNSNTLVSMFGSGKKGKYQTLNSGEIRNLTTGKTLFPGLNHPHSLKKHLDSYYYCESITRTIYKDEKSIIKYNEGYLRGLDLNDKYIITGLSKGRQISKSTGAERVFKEQALNTEVCAILIYDFKTRKLLKRINFWPEYTEIYDCLLIDNLIIDSNQKDFEINIIQNQSLYLWNLSHTLTSKLVEKETEIDKLNETVANLSNQLSTQKLQNDLLSQELHGLKESRWFKVHKIIKGKRS